MSRRFLEQERPFLLLKTHDRLTKKWEDGGETAIVAASGYGYGGERTAVNLLSPPPPDKEGRTAASLRSPPLPLSYCCQGGAKSWNAPSL